MKSNKIYLIRLKEEINGIGEIERDSDFSHPFFTEISNVVEVEEAKYIGFSNNEDVFVRLDELKFNQILSVFKKYYELTIEDVTDKVINGEMQKLYPEVECLTPVLFTDFRLENTSTDDVLDKINVTGINCLDEIDEKILRKK
jgi:hypothetical protein